MQATRHSPGTFSEAITLIARLYDRIDTLEAEKKTAAKQFETQLKAAHETIAELTKKANRLRERFELANHELTEHRRMLFGAKSERVIETPPEQPSMFPSNAAPKVRTMTVIRRVPTKTEKKKPVRQGLAAHLSREVIRLDVPEKDREGHVQMNVRISEFYRHQPAKLYVVRYERPQYVDPKDPSRGVKIAPLPPRILPKTNAGPDLLAHVVVNKYVDHLPLYRQAQRFARAGVPLSRSTLGGWVRLLSEGLAPLPEALHKEVVQCDYLQVDSCAGSQKEREDPPGLSLGVPGSPIRAAVCRLSSESFPGWPVDPVSRLRWGLTDRWICGLPVCIRFESPDRVVWVLGTCPSLLLQGPECCTGEGASSSSGEANQWALRGGAPLA